MDSVTLSIIIAAQDKASAIFGALTGKMREMGVMGDESARSLEKIGTSSEAASAKLRTVGMIASGVVAAGVVAIGIHAAKVAGDFQQLTTTLVTTAGESQKNIGMVRNGILELSTQTGTSAENMSKAMYTIESAGYHAGDGLKILKAAAEGAKAENADLTKVADATTSALRDYHLPATAAADVTSKMVAAVGAGKSTFEEFTGALHSVLPIASAAHVSLDDILGSMASMTVHGMSADQASQNLAHSIGKMQSPTSAMTQELAQLGIKSSDLSDMLGTKGISGTLQTVSEAIMTKMGPSGKVMLDAFNGNKVAASDMMQMIAAMPPKLQAMATGYVNGSTSLKDYRTSLKDLPTDQAMLMTQFQGLAGKAKGFSGALKAGINTSQSYSQALQAATGDATTMNVALMTTGENAGYTNSAVAAVGRAHAEAGGHVAGWAIIQGNFNQKMSQAKEGLHNTAIALGTALLPPFTAFMNLVVKIVTPLAEWVDKHQKLAAVILGSIGAIAALTGTVLAISAAFSMVSKAVMLVGNAIKVVTAIMAANPIILIVMAIALAAYLIITHWQAVSHFFVALWDDVKRIFDDVWGWIKNHMVLLLAIILGPFGILLGEVITHWNAIRQAIVGVLQRVTSDIKNWINDIVSFFKRMGHDLEAVITDIWHVVETIFKAIGTAIEYVLLFILGMVILAFKGIWKAIHDPVEDIWHVIVTIWNAIYSAISTAVTAIWHVITTVFQAIHDFEWMIIHAIANFLISVWNDIYNFISSILKSIWNTVTTIWNAIWNTITTVANAIWNVITTVWNAIWNTISSVLHAVWGVVSSIFSSIWNTISSTMNSIWNTIVSIWNNCYTAVTNSLNNIWSTVKDIISKIKNIFSDAGSWLLQAGKDIVMGLVHGISGMAGAAADAAKNMAKNAVDAAKSFLHINSPSLVFSEIGSSVGEGLVKGIDGSQQMVSDSAKGLASSTVKATVGGLSSGSGSINHAINNNNSNSTNNNGKVEIHIHTQALMGNQAEAQQFATQIYQQLQRIARRHGNADALPQIGILPS